MNIIDFIQNSIKASEEVSAKLSVVIAGKETVIPFFGTLELIEVCGINAFTFMGLSNGAPEPAVDIQEAIEEGWEEAYRKTCELREEIEALKKRD